MLDWSVKQTEQAVVIRTPGSIATSNASIALLDDYSKHEYDIVRKGEKVALIGAGSMFTYMALAADMLAEQGIEATLINPRNLSVLDTATLDTLKGYDVVVTAEDGIIDGGYGQKVASYLGEAPVKVVNLGLPKQFFNRYDYSWLQKACGLTPQQIAQTVVSALK